jgi:hypothetical protein
MKDRGRAKGGFARPRLMGGGWSDATRAYPAAAGLNEDSTAFCVGFIDVLDRSSHTPVLGVRPDEGGGTAMREPQADCTCTDEGPVSRGSLTFPRTNDLATSRPRPALSRSNPAGPKPFGPLQYS